MKWEPLERLFNGALCEQPGLERGLITEKGLPSSGSTRKVLQGFGRDGWRAWRGGEVD